MCYTVFIRHSLHWRSIKTALFQNATKIFKSTFSDMNPDHWVPFWSVKWHVPTILISVSPPPPDDFVLSIIYFSARIEVGSAKKLAFESCILSKSDYNIPLQ